MLVCIVAAVRNNDSSYILSTHNCDVGHRKPGIACTLTRSTLVFSGTILAKPFGSKVQNTFILSAIENLEEFVRDFQSNVQTKY